MGLEVTRDSFGEPEFRRFGEKLRRDLDVLRRLLQRPGFGAGPPSLGAELELHLVDAAGRPRLVNRRVLADTIDPRVTLEVDRFNLEINSRPCDFRGAPFRRLAAELGAGLAAVRDAAIPHEARLALIGILPTLDEADLQSSALTDGRRYRALSAGVRRIRPEPFAVRIEGDEVVDVAADDVTFEGANASFQVHLRVAPDRFADTYNAAQIATAPALAISGNSPFFLGKRLWRETRVALFRQSVDDRSPSDRIHDSEDWRPARVSFGHGWVRQGARELFDESVALHQPLLPEVGAEDPEAVLAAGGVPRLDELRLHHGTVWRWNRAIYDHGAGGHLRIEMRALPAGPTVQDMVASAAFLLGATLGLAPDAEELLTHLTFGQARRNFYAAARFGLDAQLLWPTRAGVSPELVPARELIERLLPIAHRGLVDNGVEEAEAATWLSIVAERTAAGLTGADWQRRMYDALLPRMTWQRAAMVLLDRYIELSESEQPVHTWST